MPDADEVHRRISAVRYVDMRVSLDDMVSNVHRLLETLFSWEYGASEVRLPV